MKSQFVLIGLIVATLTGCALKDWHTYKSSATNFQIEYPSNWFVLYNEKNNGILEVSSTPLKKYAHGSIPPRGTMEVTVVKGACIKPSKDFVPIYIIDDHEPFWWRKTTCLNNFQVVLDIWESVPNKKQLELLEKILGTFQTAAN